MKIPPSFVPGAIGVFLAVWLAYAVHTANQDGRERFRSELAKLSADVRKANRTETDIRSGRYHRVDGDR